MIRPIECWGQPPCESLNSVVGWLAHAFASACISPTEAALRDFRRVGTTNTCRRSAGALLHCVRRLSVLPGIIASDPTCAKLLSSPSQSQIPPKLLILLQI